MAEEEGGEEGASAKASGGGIKAILLPVISSAITAAIVGVVFMMMAPKPDANVSHESHKEEQSGGYEKIETETEHEVNDTQYKATGIYQKYDPFIVSVFDHEKVHYLKATVTLELAREDIKDEVLAKDPQIRDSLIFILGDFTLRELLDNQGKTLVKEVLIKTLNKILGKDKIVNVYFTEFTVQ